MDPRPPTLTPGHAVERVLSHARRMPFVGLVHLIERLSGDAVPVGTSGPSFREALRLRHDPSLSFPSSDIAQAQLICSDGARQVELTTAFLGLTGAACPLPSLCDELSVGDEDASLQRELLDVFHHRLLGLFVRGALKFDYPRTFRPGGDDVLSARVLALAELPAAHARVLTRLEPTLLLRLSPLLAMYPANAERLRLALATALGDELGDATVSVESFAGGAMEVSERERPRLGHSFRLGESAALGSRVPSPASLVRVAIAPLAPECVERFSPGGETYELLCAVVRLVLPPTLDFEIELTPRSSVPWSLGRNTRLGRSSWLGGTENPAPVRLPQLTQGVGQPW